MKEEKEVKIKNLSKNIKKLMKESGKRLSEISRDLGMPRTTIEEWRQGNHLGSLARLEKVADYFEVTVESLVEEELVSTKGIVTSVIIGFENCETVELKPDMFKYLYIGGVKRDITINCYQYQKGEIRETLSCKYLHIEINEKGLKEIMPMADIELRRRLIYNDITSIILKRGKREEEIYVPWCDGENCENKWQRNGTEEEGVVIDIREEKE